MVEIWYVDGDGGWCGGVLRYGGWWVVMVGGVGEIWCVEVW